MLFRFFWGSLGLVLGAFGAFLGAPFVYEQVRGGHLNFQNFFFGVFFFPEMLRAISGTFMYVLEPSWRLRWPHGAIKAQNPCIFTSDSVSEWLNHS